MKKFSLAVCLAAMLAGVLLLAGCSGGKSNEPEVNAADTVSAAIDDFKSGDIDGFYSHMNLSDEATNKETDEDQAMLVEALGPEITYEIVSSDEDLDTGVATVKVRISHATVQDVYDRALELADEADIDSTKLTEKEAEKKSIAFFKKAAKEVGGSTTDTVEVKLGMVEKDNGTYEWKIANEVLYDPLFGGELVTE